MLRSSNKKKQDIMEKGQALFWKHGFKRVTIEEICSAANVSKMTFYKFFSNKMELVKTILDKVVSYSMKEYEKIMAMDIPFSEKIQMQIRLKMEGTADISKEFMDDLIVHADDKILVMMNELKQNTFKLIYNDYVKAQKEGHIRKDIKPEFIMYFLNQYYEMMKDEQLISMYSSTSELATELLRFFFYGILENKDK